MNHLLDNDVDITGHSRSGRRRSEYEESDSADREISLGVPTILGIFFLLAIICAGFFGFGYSMGRRSAPATATVMDDTTPPGSGIAKPTAGSAAAPAPAPAEASAESDTPQQPSTQTVAVPAEPQSQSKPAASAPEPKPAAVAKPAAPPAPPAPAPRVTSAPPAGFVVQVAAVSSQDIADLLTSSLQKKGYTVAVRHEPQDKLLHLQIGPFADKKQAETMRQKVIADGFNAIVK